MPNFFGLFTGKKQPLAPFKEQGASGTQLVGGYIVDRERNPALTYLQRSTKYEEVVSNIAVVAAGVRYFTALGASAEWAVEPSEDDEGGEYAEIVERMMAETEQSWPNIVKRALMYRYWGFSLSEMTAFKTDDGLILFKSIEARQQRTIEQFDADPKNGKIIGFGQRDPSTAETLYIPREKCLYIVDNLMDDSPVGTGVLRHVYESAERLKNLLQLEHQGFAKDLRGIPIGRVPYAELNQAVNEGRITENQAKLAIAQMENLIKLSQKLPETGITLDSLTYAGKTGDGQTVSSQRLWDLELLQGTSPGLQEIGKAIERTQAEIARVLSSEQQLLSGAGSNALSKDKSANAYLAVNASIRDVVEAANKDIIPYLWKLNSFPPEMMPKFKAEDVSDKDAESVAKVLRDMATAGATLQPDDPAINDVRDALGVSRVDLDKIAEQMLMQQQMDQAAMKEGQNGVNNNL